MKIAAFVLSGMVGLAANAFAADTLTGVISDSMCAASHAAMTQNGTKMTDKQCTAGCVEHGAKYVLVESGKVLQIANQNVKDLATFAGDTVKVTGDVKGNAITVTKIEAVKK
jgi:hypothetical protein